MLHSELVPNFSKLCCIALCISVTSVECERVFSCQNRFKSKFRASLSPEKLGHNGMAFNKVSVVLKMFQVPV
jgi:hypothetical protein